MFPNYPMNYNAMFQPQVAQYQAQTSGIEGKMVDSIDAVRATDIPMNGNSFYFPKADGTEIYAKKWLANGTTQITRYKADFSDLTSQMDVLSSTNKKDEYGRNTNAQDDVINRLTSLESRISILEGVGKKKKVNANDAE